MKLKYRYISATPPPPHPRRFRILMIFGIPFFYFASQDCFFFISLPPPPLIKSRCYVPESEESFALGQSMSSFSFYLLKFFCIFDNNQKAKLSHDRKPVKTYYATVCQENIEENLQTISSLGAYVKYLTLPSTSLNIFRVLK